MRVNEELTGRDLKGIHLVAESIGWIDNGVISHLQSMLWIEGHLGLDLMGRI